jgi:hypothetical protein
MEALNRIKKGVADRVQKADDEMRATARREAEKQVAESRGSTSTTPTENGKRNQTGTGPSTGGPSSYTPPNPPRTPVGTPLTTTRPTSNDVDVELLVASLRSELDETRRRLDSFDARLEAKLGKALATFQDVASAQTKDTIDELVRKEVEKAMVSMRATSSDGTDGKKMQTDAGTFEAAMAAANASKEIEMEKENEKSKDVAAMETARMRSSESSPTGNLVQHHPINASQIDGLAGCVMKIVAEKVVPRVQESLRRLELRVSAAETLATAKKEETEAARADAAAAWKESSALRAAFDSLKRQVVDDKTANETADETATPYAGPAANISKAQAVDVLRARLEEVAEVAFSAAAAAAKHESVKTLNKQSEESCDMKKFNDDIDALKALVQSTEHVAFAAVESSKISVEKLDELSGTVVELGLRVDTNLSRAATEKESSAAVLDKGLVKKLAELTKRVEWFESSGKTSEKRSEERFTEFDTKANALFVTKREFAAEKTKLGLENLTKEEDLDKRFEAVTDFATESVSGKLKEVEDRISARLVTNDTRFMEHDTRFIACDARFAAMKQAVEREIVAVLKSFEARLTELETEGDKNQHSSETLAEIHQASKRASTLAESALRRANSDQSYAQRAERLADASLQKVNALHTAFDLLQKEFHETATSASASAARAENATRAIARDEVRQLERTVWSSILLLSEEKGSGSGSRRGGVRGETSRFESPAIDLARTAATPRSDAPSSTPRARFGERFGGLRELFKSPRGNDDE